MSRGLPGARIAPGPILAYGLALLALCLAASFALHGVGAALDGVPYSTAVYDRNGALLRLTLSDDEKYRMRAGLRDMPSELLEAVLLKEDRLFWVHPGVDPAALGRAAWHSLVRKDYRAGGSTITMQLARLLYGLQTDTVGGKLRQMAAALLLDLGNPKRKILEAYCCMVPCGGNVEGFPAASLIYLRKPVSALSLSEILLLCSIPQKPSRRSPVDDGPESIEARNSLYRLWLSRHPEDSGLSVQFAMPESFSLSLPFEAPHAVTSLLGREKGKARIDSTIDLRLQKTVERIVSRYTEARRDHGIRNACALLVEKDTMEVLAEVGSADFFDDAIDGQVNGTEARRSPGSALKPFLYALAMDQSLIHPMTMLKDAPIHFSGYNPDNFDDDFEGPIKAKDALVKSRNVPAVALAQKVKNPDMHDFLRAAGIGGLRDREDYGVSLILGTAELTMKELAALYSMLANGGLLRPLRETLDQPAPGRGAPLLSPQAAYLTLRILQDRERPDELDIAPRDRSSRRCAWKTGTSIGFRDAWSIGVFDSFVLCVWVGNFDGSGNPELIGLRSATPLMFEIIDALRASGLEKDYAADAGLREPEGIIRTRVCSVSGKIPNGFCRSTEEALFIPGKSPIDVCDIHREVHIDLRTGLRRIEPAEGRTRSEVYEIWPSDLMALFDKAGLPRRMPPPYAPGESLNARADSGKAPEIASPLPQGEYAVGFDGGKAEEIPFIAVVSSDVKTVYWFLNESYLGKSDGGKAFFWRTPPGSYVLRATDEHGRSGSCRFTVKMRG